MVCSYCNFFVGTCLAEGIGIPGKLNDLALHMNMNLNPLEIMRVPL